MFYFLSIPNLSILFFFIFINVLFKHYIFFMGYFNSISGWNLNSLYVFDWLDRYESLCFNIQLPKIKLGQFYTLPLQPGSHTSKMGFNTSRRITHHPF